MKIIVCLTFSLILATSILAETTITLKESIGIALDHSFQVKAVDQNVRAARFEYRTATAERWPTFTADANAFYISEDLETDLIFGQKLTLGSKENYQFNLQLSMPLFTGGKISGAIDLADNIYQSRQLQLQIEKNKIALSARQIYLSLMLTRAIVASTESSLERIAIIRREINDLYNNGMADSLDLLEADLAHYRGQKNLTDKRTLAEKAEDALKNLLGLKSIDQIMPIEQIPPIKHDSSSALSIDYINRPELTVSERYIDASVTKIKLERSAYFPTLASYVGYSGGKPNRDFINDKYNDHFVIGGALNWSLNLGFKSGHKVRRARHYLAGAQMQHKQLQDILLLAGEAALTDLKAARRNWEIAEKEFEIVRARYNLARKKHAEGALSTNRLLEMEAELNTGEELKRAAHINYYIKESEYLFAIGSDKIYGGL